MATDRSVLSPIVGAILTGGASRRFNGNKASIVGPRVLHAMREAGIDPIVAIGGEPGLLPIPTIADRYPGEGPLGAVATAATYARTGWLFTATCDLPLLEAKTILSMLDALDPEAPETAVVATVDGTPQVSLAIWPASLAASIHRSIRGGERRFRHLLDLTSVTLVDVASTAVADADDQHTLATLIASTSSDDMPGRAPLQA